MLLNPIYFFRVLLQEPLTASCAFAALEKNCFLNRRAVKISWGRDAWAIDLALSVGSQPD